MHRGSINSGRKVFRFDHTTGLNFIYTIQPAPALYTHYTKSLQTVTAGTGPGSDHTLGTSSGSYIYIETSAPRVDGDIARLFSIVFKANTQSTCSMRLAVPNTEVLYESGLRVVCCIFCHLALFSFSSNFTL